MFNYSENAQNRDFFEVKKKITEKKCIYIFVEKQQLQSSRIRCLVFTAISSGNMCGQVVK